MHRVRTASFITVPSRLLILVLAALTAAGCRGGKRDDGVSEAPCPARADEANQDDVRAVALANNAFALDLYRQLPPEAGENGNRFFSPLSVSTALSMTYAGARGNTAKEMARTLHYPFTGERLHLGYAGLIGKLNDAGKAGGGVQQSVANALWGPYDYEEEFLAVNRDCYAAHVRKIDLIGAEPTINRWAEERTAGRIKDLIPPDILTERSILVLTNAAYFKGEWKYQFKKSQTRNEQFRMPGGQTAQVPMMQQAADLCYLHVRRGEPGAVKLLALPYKGGDLSMVFILPDGEDGLDAVERSLTVADLDGWLNKMARRKVNVRLPRFKLAGKTFSLNALEKLGLTEAFTPEADFSGIWGKPGDLYINTVLHQGFVEVNEEGAEAAAATAIVMKDSADEKDQVVHFTADHPFLFLIRDDRTGCILFMGRLQSPK